MEKITDALSNPYVLAGGALIGVFLLMNAGKASAGTSGNAPVINPGYSSAAQAYNIAATQEVTKQAALSYHLAEVRVDADVTKSVATLATIKAFSDNERQSHIQSLISNAGIINTQLTTQAAVTMDLNNNATRLTLGTQDVQKTVIQSNAAVQIAHDQAKAQRTAAKYNMFGSIAGTVGKVATAFI